MPLWYSYVTLPYLFTVLKQWYSYGRLVSVYCAELRKPGSGSKTTCGALPGCVMGVCNRCVLGVYPHSLLSQRCRIFLVIYLPLSAQANHQLNRRQLWAVRTLCELWAVRTLCELWAVRTLCELWAVHTLCELWAVRTLCELWAVRTLCELWAVHTL